MQYELNQYLAREYGKLDSEMEQRDFTERIRFLMMAKDKDFTDYYSNRSLTRNEFYSVMDTLYELNNLCMLSDFIHQNRQILFLETQERMRRQNIPDFTEICNLGKDTIFSRMFQVMQKFHEREHTDEGGKGYAITAHRLKVYGTSSNKGKTVPQIVLQGNWVEQWGFPTGSNIRVECYPNKLVVFREGNE